MSMQEKERGAVLLTTLLIMGIMATLAVAIVDDLRFAVKRTSHAQSYAQADWYVRGAQDFAESYLEQQIKTVNSTQLNAYLLKADPIIFPIENGLITLRVRDGSQCVSLGNLDDGATRRQFRRLLIALGWDAVTAAQQTSIAVDWQDEDSQALPDGAEDYVYLGFTPAYRTSNTTFNSVQELRSLNGITEEKYQALRPFVCARDKSQETKININTLTPLQTPLLASVLGNENNLQIAMALLADKPASGYESLEQLREAPALAGIESGDLDLSYIITEPEHIWVEAEIRFDESVRLLVLEFAIEDGDFRLIQKRLGHEAMRPQLTEMKS